MVATPRKFRPLAGWHTVRLRKELSRAVEGGQPWIFREALQVGTDLPEGARTTVLARSGRPLAWGFFDRTSAIAVRVLGLHPAPRDPASQIATRLRDALTVRLRKLDLTKTNAFRWVHGEADRLPGLHIDVYDRVASVRHDGEGARVFYAGLTEQLIAAATDVAREHAPGDFTIERVVQRAERAERAERAGGEDSDVIEVRENGLTFVVDLKHGQKGGLFLDQRDNRIEIARRAAARTVLNLFGYTGAFSIHCAAAGASHTDTVDRAAPAIAAARENFRRNNLAPEKAGFHAEDAFAFLERAAQEGKSWDIVICDPPSFAPNQKSRATGLAAYSRLHRMATQVVNKGGILCAASCSSHVPPAEFVDNLKAAMAEAGRRGQVEVCRGAGFDHPVVDFFPEGEYLKFVIATLS